MPNFLTKLRFMTNRLCLFFLSASLLVASCAPGEQAKDIPQKVAGCVDLPAEKAQQLYALLYELLENQGYEKTKHIGGAKT